MGETKLNPFLAIPDGAETVLLYYGDRMLDNDAIPSEKILDYGEASYSFGSLMPNDYGLFYTLPCFMGNSDEVRFRELITEYKNVIWFNGHSHWAYKLECYNSSLNITDYNGTTATMVHVSSTGAPRTTGITEPVQKSNPLEMSEVLYNTVYDDFIITSACDFVGGKISVYTITNQQTTRKARLKPA